MDDCGDRIEVNQDQFAIREGEIGIGGVGGKAADPVMHRRRVRGGHGVVEVDVAIGCEARIEGDAHQAPLARVLHADGQKGSRQKDAVFDNSQSADLLGNKEPSIRRKCHGDGVVEAARGQGLCLHEPSRKRGRRACVSARPQDVE